MAGETYTFSDMDPFLTVGADGNVIVIYDEDVINQSIKTILATVTGERVRSPIGSRLVGLLFERITQDTADDIEDEIREVITTYEPRVILGGVRVRPDFDKNIYEATIRYRVVGDLGEFSFSTRLKTFGA